jgi:hypothetical protein
MKTNNFNTDIFLGDYNLLLSKALIELNYSHSALASPTLNKQETITFLYKNICDKKKTGFIHKIKIRILFVVQIFYYFIFLNFISIFFRTKLRNNIKYYFRTWLVPNSFNTTGVVDDYFRDLINDLSKKEDVVVGFQPQNLSSLLLKFKKCNINNNYIIPTGLLSFKDIMYLLKNYVFYGRVKLHNEYFFDGINVVKYINQSLEDDFFKFRSFFAYLEACITKKIIVKNPLNYIYIFENQAWEKSNLLLLSKTKIRTIGYQSSGFSFRFLNFFPTLLDNKTQLYPNKLYTVGDHYSDLLKKIGVYPDIIESFGALRFNYLFKNNILDIKNNNPIIYKRILYAFPVHKYQYDIIIENLILAFGNCDIEIVLKFHPLYSNHQFSKKLPLNFRIFDSKIKIDLNQFYDLVLFNDNSYGIEALIQGVRSYQFDFSEVYPEDRLINFNLYDTKLNVSGCMILKEQILNKTIDKSINREILIFYISNHYKKYNPKLNSNYF